MDYVPCFPGAVYIPISSFTTAPLGDLLPTVSASKAQIQLLSLLGDVKYTTLGEGGPRAFKDALAECATLITQRNTGRTYKYVALLPDRIPQSINA